MFSFELATPVARALAPAVKRLAHQTQGRFCRILHSRNDYEMNALAGERRVMRELKALGLDSAVLETARSAKAAGGANLCSGAMKERISFIFGPGQHLH